MKDRDWKKIAKY